MDGVACGRALDFVIAANLVPNSWMPIGITAVLTIGCRGSPPAPTPSNPVYGVERWAVKTLTDADAMHVDVSNVIATTITALNSFLNTLLGPARWPDVRRRVPCLRGHWHRAGRAELDGSGRSCCTGRSERSDEHDCRGGGQSALSGYVASADDACRTRRCSFRVSARSPADVFASVAWDSTTSRMGRLAARRAYRAASRPEHQGRVTAAPFYEAGRRSSGPLALGAMRAPSTIHPPTPG